MNVSLTSNAKIRAFLRPLGFTLAICCAVTLLIGVLTGLEEYEEWLKIWVTSLSIGLSVHLSMMVACRHLPFSDPRLKQFAALPLAALVGTTVGFVQMNSYLSFSRLYVIVILIGAAIAFLFFFYFRWADTQLLLKQSKIDAEASQKCALQSELKQLQAQVEPHFLFNTLANVEALIDESPDKAKQLLGDYCDFLRQTLEVTKRPFWLLSEEIQLLKNYLRITEQRFAEITHDIDVNGDLDNTYLPPLLLQPLVENAIIHGLGPKGNRGFIKIDVAVDDDYATIVVTDNGAGFQQQSSSGGKGIGLTNIRQRLELAYGEDQEFTLESLEKNGVEARVRFPTNSDHR